MHIHLLTDFKTQDTECKHATDFRGTPLEGAFINFSPNGFSGV